MNRFIPDPFLPILLATVALATLFPAAGEVAGYLSTVATAAVMLLFFLHGIKLPRENLVAALANWRLHLLILGSTYLVFPLLGLGLSRLWPALLPDDLWAGVLFLCALPSTVQMSIAFTSMARGNVAASVTSAAASNLLGIAFTPLIAGALLHAQGGGDVPLSGIWKVVLQLLLPFVVGHLLRPWLAAWAARRKGLISWSDRLTILLSVYSAFSAAVIDGIWSRIPFTTLLVLVLVCAALLATMMLLTFNSARLAGLAPDEQRSALYCGSFKSVVSGVPMARVLFPSAEIGAMILPVMMYHQLQMMFSATLAPRQAKQIP
ncbi:MAG: bile acid:sodium symporter family protein [Steroidobacteraceae bacterium]